MPLSVSRLSMSQKIKLYQENTNLMRRLDKIQNRRNTGISIRSNSSQKSIRQQQTQLSSRAEKCKLENKILIENFKLAKNLINPGQSVPSQYELAIYKRRQQELSTLSSKTKTSPQVEKMFDKLNLTIKSKKHSTPLVLDISSRPLSN